MYGLGLNQASVLILELRPACPLIKAGKHANRSLQQCESGERVWNIFPLLE